MNNEFTRMEEEVKSLSYVLLIARYLLILFFTILAGRLWYLQIYKGSDFRLYSENNRLKKQITQAPRGLILSRNRKTLASNHVNSELVLIPQYSKNPEEIAHALSPIIQIPAHNIVQQIKKSMKSNGLFYPVKLKKQLHLNQIYSLKLLQEQFPEISIREYIVRFYPFSENGAHIIGHMGEISQSQLKQMNSYLNSKFIFKPGDTIGQNGLEKFWEQSLRGQDGISFIEVDAHSRFVISNPTLFFNLQPQKPIPGHHLKLTVDMDIQKSAISAMKRKDHIGERKGAVVVMKTNGEILALMSSPSFDPNVFSNVLHDTRWTDIKKDLSKPLLNKALQNHYPPGSLIKPFIALAALQENIIEPDTLIDSPATFRLGRRVFHDHNRQGYGQITLAQAIEESSNTFFYKLGQELTIDKIAPYVQLFGLGQKTNIDLTGEIEGFVPSRKWKKKNLNEPWQGGEDLIHAIGQGYMLTTPIQIAVAFNAIATEGLLVQPSLVKATLNSDYEVVETFPTQITRDLSKEIDKKNFQTLKKALVQVVHGKNGTARWWKVRNKMIAGKTGTSQVQKFDTETLYQNCLDKPVESRHHGWFAAFAPAENPEVTVVVLTENSCSGSSGSAPIARDILNTYFKKYKKPSTLSYKEF